MKIKTSKIESVTLNGEEVKQLYRLLKNECEGAETAEATTYDMYLKLKHFEEEIDG